MSRLALMIDLERCIGCKSCEAACKQEHGLGPGEYRNRVLWLGDRDDGGLDFLTLTCQHCERPACLRACPVVPKAITRDPDTGIVAVNEDRCTGCGECVLACPYGAMGYDAVDHHATKCNLCEERRAEGEPTTACASVCPGRAISFGERDALLERAHAEGRSARDHDAFAMGPGTVYLEPVRPAPAGGQRALEQRQVPALTDAASTLASLPVQAAARPYRVPRAQRSADRVVPGGCNICFNCCTTLFHFRGEELVRISGNPEDPVLQGRVCPKSQMAVQLHRSEHRLTRPLRRVGKRGENRFAPVSWEYALDDITRRLQALRERHGPETLAIYSGTRSGTLSNRGWLRLFTQMWGTPNVESTEPYCSSGKNLAFAMTQGGGACGNSYTETDIGSAAMYVYIGDNQAETRPVYFGMVNDWRIRNGARMVVVDPRRTVTASKADRWLAIRPGTDLALALALAHHILAQGLHDADFCERWALGWEHWRDFLFERGYDPAWAAGITDIPAGEIARLAEEIAAADGCMIMGSRGLNQHTYSTQVNRALMFVCAITGNWGRPGGGFMNMSMSVPIAAEAPAHRRAEVARPAVRKSPSGWTTAMREGRPYPLRALICGNNPLSLWPDQEVAREALASLDLLVHMDLFPNETSAYADYVLPVATGIEKGEIGRQCDDRRVVWIDALVDPPGEAKPDEWIWTELGRRLGYGDVLREELKDPARMWDEVLIDNDQMRGVTQARLHSVPWRWVRFPVASEDAAEVETLFTEGSTAPGAPAGKRFNTPSGKLEFWSETLEAGFRQQGLSALPEFYAERESLVDLPYVSCDDDDAAPGVVSAFHRTPTQAPRARIVDPAATGAPPSPGADLRARGFDTELVTGRPPAPQFHSWTHYAWQAQEMWPDQYVQIHPDKATALGIADGETVAVESAHGRIDARAWITAGIRPSTVFVPIGWGERQPFNPWRSCNFLTDGQQRDPVSDQTNLKSLLCRIHKLPLVGDRAGD
jgi:anaerobic selenocysteine-containing dehydrogenase/Fe-S-cluster-containing dehydrogenase component